MATTLLLRRVPVLAHAVAAILSSSPNPPIALPHSVAHRHILQVTRRPTLSSSLCGSGARAGPGGSALQWIWIRGALRSTPRLQDASPSAAGFTAGSQIANDHHHATANDFHDVTVHQYNAMAALVPCALRRRMYRRVHCTAASSAEKAKASPPKSGAVSQSYRGSRPKAGHARRRESPKDTLSQCFGGNYLG